MRSHPIAALALFYSACFPATQLTPISGYLASFPDNCAVTQLPNEVPDFPHVDLATDQCHFNADYEGRKICIDLIKKDACQIGGDTIYAFKEGAHGIVVTIARRTGDDPPKK